MNGYIEFWLGVELDNQIMIVYLTGIWGIDTKIVFNGMIYWELPVSGIPPWNKTTFVENLGPIDIVG